MVHRCDEGWICEAHPDREWPHDECSGPGMPCAARPCEFWPDDKQRQPHISGSGNVVFTRPVTSEAIA